MEKDGSKSIKSTRLVIASSALFILALLAVGYELLGIKDLFNHKTNDALAENQSTDTSNADWLWDNFSSEIVAQKQSQQNTNNQPVMAPTQTESGQQTDPSNSTDSTNTNNSTPNDSEVPDEKPDLSGYVIDDFEAESADNWIGNITISSPGSKSEHAGKLSNIAGESTAARRIIETPILKRFSNLEMDVRSQSGLFLAEDASAVAFEQSGNWKWISLSDYAKDEQGWQHVVIPLSDFMGLNISDNIANLAIRFWNDSDSDYFIDNIRLTGEKTNEIESPSDLQGSVISDHQIDLSWVGNSPKYNVYRDGTLIATVQGLTYSAESLEEATSYAFYITALSESDEESLPTESLILTTSKTTAPDSSFIIANFENGTGEGWGENPLLVPGMESLYALRLIGEGNSAVGIEKIIDSVITKDHTNLEFDLNLNGSYFYSSDAEVSFDQNGWRTLSLINYIENGKSGWQHVVIPLSDFSDLNPNEAIARMIFRFWNSDSSTVDIDNIMLK